MRKTRQQMKAERDVQEFNERVAVGTEVILTKDLSTVRTRTRSAASLLGGI